METRLKDIGVGPFSGVLLLSNVKHLQTKDSRPYTRLTLKDKSAEIDAFIWDDHVSFISAGDFVKVSGEVKLRDGEQKVLRINQSSITPVKRPDNLDDYIYSLDNETREQLWKELLKFIESVNDKLLKRLLENLISKHDELGTFTLKDCPLTDESYGSYAGALLEHIIYCCRHARAVQKNYYDRNAPINPDILITIIVFHDIGRIRAFENIIKVRKSLEGEWLPTPTLSLLIFEEMSRDIQFDEVTVNKIRSGILEVADPDKSPTTLESLIAQNVQKLDALVSMYGRSANYTNKEGHPFNYVKGLRGVKVFNGS